ncbi:TPA: hypothetical protein DDZ86_03935 [Candidatus Dependentiae bacterium]|nr:MAG: hypothetical protein UW09_C0003G0141 [candidate division TM6 bacterium GW2011_GWF2_43_87]HBL98767.1 hypothetical protein [Candidatus Dependentiae bacterium]
MTMKNVVVVGILGISILAHAPLVGRWIHRIKATPLIPSIETFWSNTPDKAHYTLSNTCLRAWALFYRFDKELLMKEQLPKNLSFRYSTETVDSAILSSQMQELIQELLTIREHPKDFAHFKILKDNDFNYLRSCGVIILKFKDYPFVVKLFRETPETFVEPFGKGLLPDLFWGMGGGMTRFLAGFTRIRNKDAVEAKLKESPKWANQISLPRKWFWIPPNVPWFTVIGHNLNSHELMIEYPSLYCIVCDEMKSEREFSISNEEDRKTALELSNFLGNRLDPHICNFFIEKGTGKIALVDTEHFASMLGLEEEIHFKSYTDWIIKLARKCLRGSLFRNKKERLDTLTSPIPANLVL